MSALHGEYQRDRLPDPIVYFEGQGLRVTGKGKQRTTGCQIHGGSDSLGFNAETGCWLCRNCGAKGGDVLAHYMQVYGVGFVEAARQLGAWPNDDGKPASRSPSKALPRRVETQEHPTLSEYGHGIVSDSTGLRGTIGADYLRARHCPMPDEYGDLRFHPHVWHSPTRSYWPALIGIITDATTGEQIGIHRTYLAPDGSGKAPVKPQRMVLGHKQGGRIRLWPDEAVTTGLAVAEGIETALSLAHAYQPVWSLIDAGNLGAFPVLAGIETLVIGRDNDPAGRKAATDCATRWTAAGVEVLVTRQEQNDINDALTEAA